MDEQTVVLLLAAHVFLDFADAFVHVRKHDVHGLAERFRHLGDADGRTEAVIVLVVMPHDVDGIRRFHDFLDGMRDDTRLDARMLFDGFRAAAEELRLAA